MELIGQSLKHKQFGKGIITECKETIITVYFETGEKKFIYPDAFSKYLVLSNSKMQKKNSKTH